MTHDPLCPCNESGHTHYEYSPSRVCTYCRCTMIAKVREDVVNRFCGAAWDAGYAFGVNHAREAVMGAWRGWTGDDNCTTHPCENCRTFGRAVSAINALWEEKP
jgi:hypothetical protein